MLPAPEYDDGAPGRTRTGTAFRPTDFRTLHGFHRRAFAFGVWNAPRPWQSTWTALGPRRPLSTPASVLEHTGLARRCLGSWARGFTDFDGLQTSRFRSRRSQYGSPLRLPITSPGQGSSVSQIRYVYGGLAFLAMLGRRPDVTSFSGFFVSKCSRPSTMRDE
jgi:hypothetical protein